MFRPGPAPCTGMCRSAFGNFHVTADGKKSLTDTLKQLGEYFKGRRRRFSVPLKIRGTDFQKKVWRELVRISYGRTASYKEIAARVGRPRAWRAVAGAVAANKILVLIPCHRVIRSNQSLGGYAAGPRRKRLLLGLEKSNVL